jgi:hypothetical protein
VIISHEILATASREHVRRALDSFGAVGGVDVVVSVRDLVRQIPAEWQENVKHRRTIGYHDFLSEIQDPESTGKLATWFWGVQDIPSILDRWGADLPPERVHVLTVPKPGAPRNLLWERFASVFGLVPEDFDTSTVDKANPSLGVAESALLVRINKLVNGVLPNEQYRELVRELLAHRTLSRREQAVRLRLPDDVRGWAVARSEEWIELLATRPYDVVGSLEELRPDPVELETEFVDPDDDLPEPVGDAAIHGLVTVLLRAGEMRQEIDHLLRRVEELTAERDQARREVGLVLRKKRAFVAQADSSRAAALALGVYRRARRLSGPRR